MSDLIKRSQAERIAIAQSLLTSVWQDFENGDIDRNVLQAMVYIEVYVNRILWKLNKLNNERSLDEQEKTDNT